MPRTVLVVDDSAPFRATARGLLEARGYDVVGDAADGAAGLAAARALRPDAVLLDVNLPDVDGMTVASQLDGGDGYAPAVVLVSTLDAASFGSALESCGARGFVPKADLGSPRLIELLGPPDAG
jgi:DNA-binding NarL/FixJ family response regulator